MDAILYPLAASKMLKHCEIFLSNMKLMDHEEIVELSFNEFVSSANRTLQYLEKEIKKVDATGFPWFKDKRDNLYNASLFYELRHIIAHHFFINLTPIIGIEGNNIPEHSTQVTEYRLDLEMLQNGDKKFDAKRKKFIQEIGPSVNAISLCENYFHELSSFVKEAEIKYGNKEHYLRSKVRSKFRVNDDLTLAHYEKSF